MDNYASSSSSSSSNSQLLRAAWPIILTLVFAVFFVAQIGISLMEKLMSIHTTENATSVRRFAPDVDMLNNGTWVFYRGTANIEWCENVVAAYEYHDQIAEFFNCISNLAFVTVAVLGLKRAYDSHYSSSKKNEESPDYYPPLPNSFAIGEVIMLVGVGFGSALFHAHQSRFSQLADELPMSMLIMVCLHSLKGLHPLTTDPKYSRPLFTYSHATVVMLWAVYLYTHQFDVFSLCFMLQVVEVLIITFDAARRMKQSQKKFVSTVVWIVGAKILWEIERHRFEKGACEAPYTLWLHPLWHIGSSISHYYSMENMADLVKTAKLLEEAKGMKGPSASAKNKMA